jgi:hypothetical protein
MATRILLVLLALLGAACGDGGGGGSDVSPPAQGACPDATSLQVTTNDTGEFTLNVVSDWALLTQDDSLYGTYYNATFADFKVEPSTSITTEGDQRAVVIEVYSRDMTKPPTGTFDFEGQQNTFFQPSFQTGATSQPVTTLGDGGTLTLTVADEERLCGSIDVTDGSVTIRGGFAADVQRPE